MDTVRVLRILEYVGPRDLIEAQIANSIHGTREFGRGGECRITAATIGTFPEILETKNPLLEAVEALGVMPEGYCFCSSNRVGDDSKTHEPECAELRAEIFRAQERK